MSDRRSPLLERRETIFLALSLIALLAASAAAAPPAWSAPVARQDVDAAINRGVDWLVAQQTADGVWRSTAYTQLGAGPAATALATSTLMSLATAEPHALTPGVSHAAIRQSLSYLLKVLPPQDFPAAARTDEYPTYAAVLTLLALQQLPAAEREPHAAAIGRLHDYLVAAQVTAPLPNKIATAEDVGGWGLVGGDPADPSSFRTPNVSTTRFVLEALRPVAAEHPETFRRALQFLARRQRADGGFSFLSDPLDQLNKAGADDPPRDGEPFIPRSYGTTTADGLLALRAAGLPAHDRRVVAAAEWLDAHPQLDTVPGFPSDAVSSDASSGLYYYYAAALAEAMAAHPDAAFALRAPRLAAELVARQRPDGSWANSVATMREDDPLVATALALRALAAINGTLNHTISPPSAE